MLHVKNISFSYTDDKPLIEGFEFSLQKGEHLCVMGESGCGKSTLLKVIYGLYDLNKGSMFWETDQILGPSYHLVPGMKYFKYVAQDFDLMPFTSVADNISKFLSRIHIEETKKRTKELLEVIEMTAFADAKVKTLSGGQKQRVAIARALALEPELILLDEPFGQIDSFKKRSLRRLLFSYLKEKNIACIVATHDAEDALSFADQMIVIRDKKIIANDKPIKLYQNPKENYIAALFEDVNQVEVMDQKLLLYPHQINIVNRSQHKAHVINCYFKGFFWLIELNYMDQIIFLNHHEELEKSNLVYLNFKKN